MQTRERIELNIRPLRETASYLEKHLVPVDINVASWLDREFVKGRAPAVVAAIEAHGEIARKLHEKRSHSSDYENAASQWRGAAVLYAPESVSVISEKDNPLLDTLVYMFSAMQDYKGAAVIDGGPFLRAQKSRGVSINPITDEPPWNPNEPLSRGDWKRVKPRQSVVLPDGRGTLLRAVKGAERVPEGVMRALTILSVASEDDPDLLAQTFNWFKFQIASIPNGIAPALGVLEVATRLGQQNNPAFAPLMKFLPWYVREHSGNSDAVISRYAYVSNEPGGVLYTSEPAASYPPLPDAKRIRAISMRIEAMEERIRQLRGSHNLVLASIGLKDLSQLRLLRSQISSAKSEEKRLVTRYLAEWNGIIDGIAQSVGVSTIVMEKEPTETEIRQTEEILDELFGGSPFVPSKATPANEGYKGHIMTTRWALNSPLVRLRYLMDNPTFETAIVPYLKKHPHAVFELMKQTYAAILREKYLARAEKVDRFLRLTTLETVEGFEYALSLLLDSYPGHYLGRKLQERHQRVLARFQSLVDGRMLSRGLDMRAIRKSWKYENARKAYVWNYRRDLMYLTLISTAMLIAFNADGYLALMKKAEELSQKLGLSLDSADWKLPQPIEDWIHGDKGEGDDPSQNKPVATGTPVSTPSAPGEERPGETIIARAVSKPKIFFEPPTQEERNNQNQESQEDVAIRYAKIIQQPDTPVNEFYVALSGNDALGQFGTGIDKINRVNFFVGIDYPENSLVLETTNLNYFYAPPGWEIVAVYTTSDVEALQTKEGAIAFLGDPGRVRVAYRQLVGGDPVFQRETVDPYDRQFDVEDFEALNEQLSIDPVLQSLQRNVREELDAASSKKEESEIIIKYLDYLRRYILTSRYYSRTTEGLDQSSDGLVWVASHSGLGFECEVADRMAAQFLASVGVVTERNGGEFTTRHGSGLWGDDTTHVNTRVILPDGRIMTVDFTPLPSEETPSGAIPAPADLDFMTVYRDEIRKAAGWAGATILGGACIVGIARSFGKRRNDRRRITKEIARTIQNTPPVEELPAMDASETELVLAMAYYISTLAQEPTTDGEIRRLIGALSRYRPAVGAKGRAAFIVDVAGDDESAMPFLATSAVSVMRRLAKEYGSRAIHASMPPAITEEIARYQPGNPAVSQVFADYARLVRAMWEAMSGFVELRASVVTSLDPMEFDPRERTARARALIEEIFKETTVTSENKYAISLLWALDAVLNVTTPKQRLAP